MKNLNTKLLAVALLASAISTEATAQQLLRLKAATYTKNSVTVDSQVYSYASNLMPCLPTVTFSYNQYFPMDQISIVGLYDSAINQIQPASNMYDRVVQDITSGGMITQTVQERTVGSTLYKTTNTFDNSGNILQSLNESINSTTSTHTFYKEEYTYSGGLLVKREKFYKTGAAATYVIQQRTTYSYTGGLLSMELLEANTYPNNTFGLKNRYIYIYNTSNQLIEKQTEDRANNAWRAYSKTVFTYTSAGNIADQKLYSVLNGTNLLQQEFTYAYSGALITQIDQSNYSNGTVNYTYTADVDYNSNNKITAVTYTSTNAGVNNYLQYVKSNYDYNTSGQLEKAYQQNYDVNTQSWILNTTDSIKNYYYEPYISVSVANTKIEEASVSLFPNPANSVINISADWTEPQAFTVAIYNTSGQIIRQWAEEPTANYKKQIPVTDLSAGTYFIKIKGDSTDISKQLTILH